MIAESTNPLLLNESSHVLALLSGASLNIGRPEASAIFERAAELEHNIGCDVTIMHVTKPASTIENLKEHLALRVLVKRANEYFDADFDVVIRYGRGDYDDIRRLVADNNGDLLLVDHTEADALDTNDELLQQSSFPLWYVAKRGEIDEVFASLSGVDSVQSNNQVTRKVAQHLGANFGSDVGYMKNETDPTVSGDLVVTYAPTGSNNNEDLTEYRHAKCLLASVPKFDVLVHRGSQSEELAHAA